MRSSELNTAEYREMIEESWDEHKHQKELKKRLDSMGLLWNATPNGGKRNIGVAKKLKAEGVSKGFPDITVFLPSIVLYIELKKLKGSYPTKEQKEWIDSLNKLKYASARCCKGWREAMQFVNEHLPKKEENPKQSHLEDYL